MPQGPPIGCCIEEATCLSVTVNLQTKDALGSICWVLYREAVLFSEVHNVFELLGNQLFGTSKIVLVKRSIVLCPYLRGSTIRGFTVYTCQCRRNWCAIGCLFQRAEAFVTSEGCKPCLPELLSMNTISNIQWSLRGFTLGIIEVFIYTCSQDSCNDAEHVLLNSFWLFTIFGASFQMSAHVTSYTISF